MLIRTLAAGILAGTAFTPTAATAATGHEPAVPVIVFLNGNSSAAATGTGPTTRWGEEGVARQAGATGIRPLGLVRAFAARMTPATAARLARQPGVSRVIPDGIIHGPDRVPAPDPAPAGAPSGSRALAPPPTMPGACGPSPSLEPEALELTRTDGPAQSARKLGYTGTGVNVGFLADGLDPGNVNFQRDGKSAITDYRDFSGDGPTAPTNGDEAFLDASAIAGQGQHVYDVRKFGDAGPSVPCPIRVEGAAPGADVDALKVFGQQNQTTTSNFLQALSYAVTADHADVLSESFGSNPFPDVASLDAVKQFNDAATARGVTVVVSSGDAGPFNTIGSPASDPRVLSAGASTAFRFYAQTDYAEADSFARRGWIDDNISALSSSGFTADGRTVSLVAPGDLGWASCTASARRFSGCSGFAGHPSALEESGGTSEAAPEIAGAAALVIQAYRHAHRGASPSPALVKRILTSSASDLGAPAPEQGAGLLDAYRAVRLAASSGSAAGSGVLLSASQLSYAGAAGSRHSWRVRVTNPGPSRQVLSLRGRGFGTPRRIARGSVVLSDVRSPHVTSAAGTPVNYGTLRFRVPAGQGLLDASLSWPVTAATRSRKPVRLDLISPSGKLAADSIPQGNGGSGSAQVTRPEPGVWRAVAVASETRYHGSAGRVRIGATVTPATGFGRVSPRSLAIPAGATRSFTVSAAAPQAGGDTAGSVVFRSPAGTGSLPVILRGLVPVRPGSSASAAVVSAQRAVAGPAAASRAKVRQRASAAAGGRFSGVLTGGNGRAGGGGQSAAYQFTVARGTRGVRAGVVLANDPGNQVAAYLVGPGGQVAGTGTNKLATRLTAGGSTGPSLRQLAVFAANPVPGRWTLLLDFAEPVPGNELADPYTGTISLGTVRVTRGGLPSSASAVLARGKARRYRIAITNPGPAPEAVFLDARLRRDVTAALRPQGNGNARRALPLSAAATGPEWLVPSQTGSVTARASSAVPVTFDIAPLPGEPDVAAPTGKSVSAAYPPGPAGGPVTPGLWQAFPSEAGPYAGPAPRATVTMGLTARTLAFDPSLTASPAAPDLWRYATRPLTGLAGHRTLVIGPGQTRVITAVIRPSAAPGTVVRGTLYVDDLARSPQFLSGSELAALPYEYRVK